MATEISEPVRRFIARHVHSAAQLEVLLLLRTLPDRDWSIDEVARAQVTSAAMAEQLLRDLRERGLVARDEARGRFFYRPPPGLDAVVDLRPDLEGRVTDFVLGGPLSAVWLLPCSSSGSTGERPTVCSPHSRQRSSFSE